MDTLDKSKCCSEVPGLVVGERLLEDAGVVENKHNRQTGQQEDDFDPPQVLPSPIPLFGLALTHTNSRSRFFDGTIIPGLVKA